MVKIVSMSLNDKILEEIDLLQKEMGFSGRSEAIRAGVRLLSNEHKQRIKLKGVVNAVLSVIHLHSDNLAFLVHKHQNLVSTHIHNHIDHDHCLDIFVLKGEAQKIRKLVELFEAEKKIEHVKLTIC